MAESAMVGHPKSQRVLDFWMTTWKAFGFGVGGLGFAGARWWQLKYLFIFTPNPGEMIQFDEYFSNGLKPPARVDFEFVFGWVSKKMIRETLKSRAEATVPILLA